MCTYEASTGKTTVPAETEIVTVTGAGAEDTDLESDETFTVSVGGVESTGTITNDDAVPTITGVSQDVSAEEGEDLAFNVTLSNTADTVQTYDFSLTDGTTDSSDYGNVTFSNGVTYDAATGKITVQADTESINGTGAGAGGTALEDEATLNFRLGGIGSHGTIPNDEEEPTIRGGS